MSTSTASHTLAGHALYAEVSRFFGAMFSAPKSKPAAKAAPVAAAEELAAVPAAGVNIWKLYRMSAGMDSVNPALFADRIVHD